MEQTRASLTDTKRDLATVSEQRDDLNTKLTAEQTARSQAEQALAAANTEP